MQRSNKRELASRLFLVHDLRFLQPPGFYNSLTVGNTDHSRYVPSAPEYLFMRQPFERVIPAKAGISHGVRGPIHPRLLPSFQRKLESIFMFQCMIRCAGNRRFPCMFQGFSASKAREIPAFAGMTRFKGLSFELNRGTHYNLYILDPKNHAVIPKFWDVIHGLEKFKSRR